MATSTSGDTRRVVDSVVESEDLVVVELRGLDCNDKPAHQKLATCKFLKLDEDEPIIQVGNQFFKGTLENVQGTAVFFEDVTDPKTQAPSTKPNEPQKEVKYFGKTEKMMSTRRIFIEPNVKEN